MQALQLELAAEYLVMAAMLAEIKSRLLLPRPAEAGDDEDDPRAELVRRLQEYERFRRAAEDLDALPRLERDLFAVLIAPPERAASHPQPPVELGELMAALRAVLTRAEHFEHHHVQREPLSVRERMSQLLERLDAREFTPLLALFRAEEGRPGVVITFLATLELIREALVELVQAEPFAPIYLRMRS
jgi:segregation and condensation protein A